MKTPGYEENSFEWPALEFSSDLKPVQQEVKNLGFDEGITVKNIAPGLVITKVDAFPQVAITSASSGPPNFSMTFIFSGHGAFELDGGSRVDISQPTVVLFASDKHSSGVNYVYPGVHFRMLNMSCGHEFLQKAGGHHLTRFSNELLNDHSVPEMGAYMITFPLPTKLRNIAEDVMNCQIQNEQAEALLYKSKALECLAYIIELSSKNTKYAPNLKEADQLKLSKAKQLLENEFQQDWSIASLAREVGLNEKKLKSGFRHIIGQTVNEYRRTMRMEAAKKMLQDDEPVTQVALATGFSSMSHFSKTFREYYGISPSKYARHEY